MKMTEEEYVDKLTDFITDSFKRHFSKKFVVCTDCGGFSLFMCEKAFKETIATVARRILQDSKDFPKSGDELMPPSPIQTKDLQ